jgi:hypothetical protein
LSINVLNSSGDHTCISFTFSSLSLKPSTSSTGFCNP